CFVQLRIAKVKQTTTNGIDSTYAFDTHPGRHRCSDHGNLLLCRVRRGGRPENFPYFTRSAASSSAA
ncbi:MAG: hypothetical protein MZV70_34565, partial [Desulfobacterales bacterium]|nr:hypothetical protein [Desulfobacterales bacterium]